MATQYGFECWCSHDVDLDYARHSDDLERVDGRDYGLCGTRCEGDKVSILHGTIPAHREKRWKPRHGRDERPACDRVFSVGVGVNKSFDRVCRSEGAPFVEASEIPIA